MFRGARLLPSVVMMAGLGLLGAGLASAADTAPPITWPGALDTPKSIRTSNAYGILLGRIGEALPLVSRADEEMAPSTTTEPPFNDDTVGGSILQTGQTTTTITTSIHAGHVSMDMAVTANVAYTTALDGKALGSQRSTGTAHFDVSPCPEVSGVAGGHISFHFRQDATFPDGSRSSSTSSAEGPFRIINGDDAHRVRTEIDLQITSDSLHTAPPGSETDPVGWGVTGPININRGGNEPFSVGAVDESQWKGSGQFSNEEAGDNPATDAVQGFMLQLDQEVEKFWRSGKCIKLKPSEKSRKVKPQEKIELTVEAEHNIDHKEVKTPIKAELTGVKSIDPKDKPVDEPAKFDYVAGEKRGDHGEIKLTQTGKRGIGETSVTFTVDPSGLMIEYSGSWLCGEVGHGNWNDVQVAAAPTRLEAGEDGIYRGTVDMTSKGTDYSSPHNCHADVNVVDSMKIVAELDKTDPTLVHLHISPVRAHTSHELYWVCTEITPGLKSTYYPIEWWGRLVSNHTVTIGKPTVISASNPTSLAENKTSIKFTITLPPSQ